MADKKDDSEPNTWQEFTEVCSMHGLRLIMLPNASIFRRYENYRYIILWYFSGILSLFSCYQICLAAAPARDARLLWLRHRGIRQRLRGEESDDQNENC